VDNFKYGAQDRDARRNWTRKNRIMEYKNLGNSGLQVSALGLGCNNIGRQVDQAGTQAIVDMCLDHGMTFFDTADVYGAEKGRSEEYLGRALKPHRRDVVIATKGSGAMGDGPYWSGASRRYLIDALDASLRRLDTDYIDLYQVHFPDPRTPIEETLRALDDMVRSGKVRYVGCSNYSGVQIADAAAMAAREHFTPLISAQNRYNMLQRDIEKDVVPASLEHGLGVLPFYPLAAGLLTGKYRAGEPPPEGTRLTSGIHFYDGVLDNADFPLLERLTDFAQERGHTLLELAIGWLASQPAVGSVMTGATRVEQIEQNIKSSEWRLTPLELNQIDGLMKVAA
jgi:aryl-alcohol dehydrogenase-like predicted oxidoreductase